MCSCEDEWICLSVQRKVWKIRLNIRHKADRPCKLWVPVPWANSRLLPQHWTGVRNKAFVVRTDGGGGGGGLGSYKLYITMGYLRLLHVCCEQPYWHPDHEPENCPYLSSVRERLRIFWNLELDAGEAAQGVMGRTRGLAAQQRPGYSGSVEHQW